MKRPMVYILAFTMLCSALLSGCGEHKDKKPLPTNDPTVTDPLPDVEDGIVNDTDGIITDDDAGDKVDTDAPIHAGSNDMDGGNVSADPDVNAAAYADREDKDSKSMRP